MAISDSRPRPYVRYLQLISAFLGIALSLYLLAQHTRLKSGIQGGSSFCSLGKHADCDVVNSSAFSEVLGVPIAGVGAVYFFLLLLLVLISSKKSGAQTWIARLALLGLGFDLVLLVIQIAFIQSVCLVCFTTYLANLGLLWGAAASRGKGWKSFKEVLTEPNSGPLIPPGPMGAVLGISAVLFAIIVGLIPSAIRLTSKNYALVDSAIEQFFASWPEKKNKVIDWKEGDGVLGNPKAAVRIVEFSDFECPFCRNAAFTLHTALDPLKDQVYFVFKQFPLDPTCNPVIQHSVHPNACALARLAYCSKKKGKFWEYHDIIFLKLSQEAVAAGVSSFTPELASILSKEEVASCLNDPASLDNVVQDAKLGKALEIRGTPTVFINGKAVTIPLTVESLRRLVALELSLQPKTSP